MMHMFYKFNLINSQLKNGDISWCPKVIVDSEDPVHVCILGNPAYSLLPYLMKECANEGRTVFWLLAI